MPRPCSGWPRRSTTRRRARSSRATGPAPRPDIADCLEIREKLATDPKVKMPRIALMVALARCGEHARAAAIARELVAQPPKNEMVYFEAACGFALSAGAVRDQSRPTIPAAGGLADSPRPPKP